MSKIAEHAHRAIFASIFVLMMGIAETAAQDMPPTLVEIDTLEAMEFHEQITLVGRSEGTATSAIVSEVAGQVKAIVAEEGTPIKKGAILIEIDSERLRLDLAAKEGEVIEATEQSQLAKKNIVRAEEMFARKLIPEVAVDSSRAWVTMVEGRLKKLTAERDRFARDVDDCRVKAPFTGYTSRRLTNVGEWVNRGTPVYEMVDISRLRVVVDLPERYFGRLSAGSPVTIYASGDTTRPISGVVTGVTRSANTTTHTYPVIITIENPSGTVGGGALVKAVLSFDQVFSSLAVHKDAIVRQGAQQMVYTIQEGKAAPIPVTTSAIHGPMIAISGDGIAPGMVVVVRGNERIFPGAPVRTAESAPQTGGGGASAP